MVCKEEVLLWFKDLDSHNRIDLVYELLNMCLPFELRFFGSCIEELGKHTYSELRGPTLTSNDLEKLSKDASFNQGILDESVRHRLIIYLSVLSSRNYSVANWFFKKLLRTESIEEYLKDKGKNDMLHSEYLLLYTMALHHPAFTFEQKQFFSRVLLNLIDFRENRVSAKHSALGYPPGFGYPTQKPMEVPMVPVKSAPTTCGDSPAIFHQPPGLPHLPPPPHVDFSMTMWSRPGFPYGAPEVPPFPAPTISPLVSQAASPSQSRSTSPHRTQIVRPPPPPPLGGMQPPMQSPSVPPPLNVPPQPSNMEIVIGPIVPTQLSMDPPPIIPVFNHPPDLKTIEDDSLNLVEEKRDILWPQPSLINPEVKPNGIRFPPFVGNVGKIRPYLIEQMQAMNLEGENSLHLSNSSSNSSPNETPPGTPSITPATTPHGPGRGDAMPRSNGMSFGPSPGPPSMPDTQSPPPPNFTNSSVPYSFPQQFTTLPPNRSMFPYNQAYRPTFTAQFPNYPTDNNFPTYTLPYFPIMYSSQYQPRTPPGCYNCGAHNHVGSECTSQNIEEITQKKTYVLDYISPLPDSEK